MLAIPYVATMATGNRPASVAAPTKSRNDEAKANGRELDATPRVGVTKPRRFSGLRVRGRMLDLMDCKLGLNEVSKPFRRTVRIYAFHNMGKACVRALQDLDDGPYVANGRGAEVDTPFVIGVGRPG